ncbi:hypothetical protein [Streptomyces venezuelae]|uniref:hypothetical protein n=1 Tax=Streptomyces venezuelae TaxID=54571 RepID=UPI0037B988DE
MLAGKYWFDPGQSPALDIVELERLRVQRMAELLDGLQEEPAVSVVPYTVASLGPGRHAAMKQLRRCVTQTAGWHLAEHSFCDTDARLLGRRPGLAAACRYTVLGPARGLLVPGRAHLSGDLGEYEFLVRYLYGYRCFVAYAPQLAAR